MHGLSSRFSLFGGGQAAITAIIDTLPIEFRGGDPVSPHSQPLVHLSASDPVYGCIIGYKTIDGESLNAVDPEPGRSEKSVPLRAPSAPARHRY